MIKSVADRSTVSLSKQQIVDHLFQLEDVDIHFQVRIALTDLLNGARHHDLSDTGHRTDSEFGKLSTADLADDIREIVDLFIDRIDLFEDELRILGRNIAAVLTHEEAYSKRSFGIFDETADAGSGDIEKLCGTGDRSRDHNRPDYLDLPQRHHRGTIAQCRLIGYLAMIERLRTAGGR